jgi:hypothetical protein
MRIQFKNVTHPSRVAKSLKKRLAEYGHTFKLAKCQAIVADMSGYADWHELNKIAGTFSSSLPDALVGREELEERRCQYVAALTRAGVSFSVASVVVADVSPTSGGGDGAAHHADASFILAQRPRLASLDLSPSAVSAHTGLLRLIESVHKAALATPFWAERSSWNAFCSVPLDAVAMVGGMRRSPSHTFWGPSMVGALKMFSTRTGRGFFFTSRAYVSGSLVSELETSGVSAFAARLEALDNDEFATLVAMLSATCGASVLVAGSLAGKIDACLSKDAGTLFVEDVYSPWVVPTAFSPRREIGSVWRPFTFYEATRYNPEVPTPKLEDLFSMRIADSSTDRDVAALAGCFGRTPNDPYETLRLLDETDAVMFMLGIRRADGFSPVVGAVMRKTLSPDEAKVEVEISGLWLARKAPAGSIQTLVSVMVMDLVGDLVEWEKIVVPGNSVELRLSQGKGSSGEMENRLWRALAYRNDSGYPVGYSLRRGANMPPLPALRCASILDDEVGIAAKLSDSVLNSFLQRSLVVAVKPAKGGYEVWHNGKEIDLWRLSDYQNDWMSGHKAEDVNRFVRALGRRSGVSDPVIVVGLSGSLFLTDEDGYRKLTDGRGVVHELFLVGKEPSEAAAHEIAFRKATFNQRVDGFGFEPCSVG